MGNTTETNTTTPKGIISEQEELFTYEKEAQNDIVPEVFKESAKVT